MDNKIIFLKNYNTNKNLILFIIFVIMNYNFNVTNADCPKVCDCKWKNGKETVLCTNVNLTIIPHNLDPSTQVLDLTGNEITKVLHDAFLKVGLINLQKVFLQRCKLKMIDRYAFRKIKNLIELDLSYNSLNFIPSQIFNSITELRELKLNGNPIQKITNDAFSNLPQLLRLELSNCKINFIDRYSFKGIEHTLEWLKLDGNKIMDIQSPITITSLENLNGIELNKNPWNCSCTIKPIAEFLIKFKISQSVSPVCRFPTRLLNRSWDRLTLDEFACMPIITTNYFDDHSDRTDHEPIIEYENANITLICYFNDFIDKINIKWKINNKFIHLNSNTNLITNKKYNIIFLNNQTQLTINNLDRHDNGLYSCHIENKAGQTDAIFNLDVLYKKSIFNYVNLYKIIIFIIFFIFLIFIIFITFVISIILYRRKNKIITKDYNNSKRATGIDPATHSSMTLNSDVSKTNSRHDSNNISHDYEKLDHFNIPFNKLNINNKISSSILLSNSFSNTNSYNDATGSWNNNTNSNNNNNNNSLNKIEDLPLRQYREYKHIPSNDHSDSDEDDDDNDTDSHNNYNENETMLQESGDIDSIRFNQLNNSSKSKRSIINNFKKCKSRSRDGDDDKASSVTVSTNCRKRGNNAKRRTAAKLVSNGIELNIDQNQNGNGDDLFASFNNTSVALPLKGYKPNFTQHIMVKKNLDSTNCSLYTTEVTPSTSEKKFIPDLLDLPNKLTTSTESTANKHNFYEDFFNSYSTLPITKTTMNFSTNNSNSSQNDYYDDSQASLLSSTTTTSSNSNEKLLIKRRNVRRYSIDSCSYIPTSSNNSMSTSTFSLLTSRNSDSLSYKTKRSNSYLNLVSPEIKSKSLFTDTSFDEISEKFRNEHKITGIPSTATPLLDFSNFPVNSRITTSSNLENQLKSIKSSTDGTPTSKFLYDYHTSQLEYFLQEYRKLQEKLKTIGGLSSIPLQPIQLDNNKKDDNEIGQSAKFADPLMFNDAWYSSSQPSPTGLTQTSSSNAILSKTQIIQSSATGYHSQGNPNLIENTSIISPGTTSNQNLTHTISILKKKPLVNWNKSPDPPPYWLHRNAMFKQMTNTNNSDTGNSKPSSNSNETLKS